MNPVRLHSVEPMILVTWAFAVLAVESRLLHIRAGSTGPGPGNAQGLGARQARALLTKAFNLLDLGQNSMSTRPILSNRHAGRSSLVEV